MRTVVLAATVLVVGACGEFGADDDAAPQSDAGAGTSGRLGPDASAVEGGVVGGKDGGDGAAPRGGASYREEVLADGPLLYYRLGDLTAPAALNFGRTGDANGVYTGKVTFGVPGAIANDPDTAVAFGASDARLDIPALVMPEFADQARFTIEAWVKPSEPSPLGYAHLVAKESGGAGEDPRLGYALYIEQAVDSKPAAFAFERWSGGKNDGKVIFGSAITPNQFSHVVGTYDGTAVRLYVNGVVAGPVMDSRPIDVQPSVDGKIGAGPGPVRFNGVLDEIAVYAVDLGPERVQAHFAAARP